ncbi:DnaJ: heat shock protein [Desulfosarcina variabilis str. Montpellier]|uniref:DnaJ domain-containing protein n=1 Tax=Desulfosarcina variabilis TaxID=2300 RepID=UPI003AFAD98D
MNNVIIILIIIGALLYLVFPRDLIPDFLIGWGWIDDLAVLYVLWRYYRRIKLLQQTGNRSDRPHSKTAGDEQSRAADSETRSPKDPYTILGITPGATQEEIKAAYRRLAGQYHPDKVQHLGKEFQELAEKRFKEIQQAYDDLIFK